MKPGPVLTWVAVAVLCVAIAAGWFGLDPAERRAYQDRQARLQELVDAAAADRDEAQSLREEARAIEVENGVLRERLGECASENDVLQAEVDTQASLIEEAEARIAALSGETLALREQVQQTQRALALAESQGDRNQAEIGRLMATLAERERDLQAKEAEIAREQDRRRQVTRDRDMLQVRATVCATAGRESSVCQEQVRRTLARLVRRWDRCVDGGFGAPIAVSSGVRDAGPPGGEDLGAWGGRRWWLDLCDERLGDVPG